MSDWTTKKISDDLEIDLHYDLLSFPAILKSEAYGRIVMSDSEVRKLYSILTEYYKEEYGNEMAPKNS